MTERYRVVLEFRADYLGAAERYAADIDRVWDAHPGITDQLTSLFVTERKWKLLAEPIMRNPPTRDPRAGGEV